MRNSLIGGLLVACALLLGAANEAKDQGWKPTPMMRSVDVETARVGDIITVTGEYLDKARVAEVYLIAGKAEYKMTITEQAETTLKAKVPEGVQPGRLRFMVLTKGVEPQLLEQPVTVLIE